MPYKNTYMYGCMWSEIITIAYISYIQIISLRLDFRRHFLLCVSSLDNVFGSIILTRSVLQYHIFEGTTGSCQNPIGRHSEKERSKRSNDYGSNILNCFDWMYLIKVFNINRHLDLTDIFRICLKVFYMMVTHQINGRRVWKYQRGNRNRKSLKIPKR